MTVVTRKTSDHQPYEDNHRNDKCGGDLTGRMRFGLECVAAMRAASGADYPIFYRLGAWEDMAQGITLDESGRFASELEKVGADVIDVSLGGITGPCFIASPGSEQPEGTFVSLAEAIKGNVTIPVIAVDRFRTPEVAEAVVAEGKADMVAVGRQLIADPHWPQKVTDGRAEDILPCISCNACFETGFASTGLRCSVNASAGRELETVIVPAERAKRVLVIGGGPAGMEAARVAAQRGHRGTLHERERELGGQLRMAAAPPYKQEIVTLRDYLVLEVFVETQLCPANGTERPLSRCFSLTPRQAVSIAFHVTNRNAHRVYGANPYRP